MAQTYEREIEQATALSLTSATDDELFQLEIALATSSSLCGDVATKREEPISIFDLGFKNQSEYDQAMAEQMHIDIASAAAQERVSSARGIGTASTSRRSSIDSMAEIERKADAKLNYKDVDLRKMANWEENVHDTDVEQPLHDLLDELEKQPLIAPVDDIVPNIVIAAIMEHDGIEKSSKKRVIDELSNNSLLSKTYKKYNYKNVLAIVYSTIAKSKDTKELIKRLAEEIEAGTGVCDGGKINRLVSSLMGFIDCGAWQVHVGKQSSFMDAFAKRVTQQTFSSFKAKENAAVAVLDEYGVGNPRRQDFLDALEPDD